MLWTWVAALVFMTVVMVAAWFVQRTKKNAGWADVFWDYGMGIAGAGCALVPEPGHSISTRQILLAALIALWSLRVGTHILRRVSKGVEDGRYVETRRLSSGAFQPLMYFFFQVQAWVGSFFAMAIYVAAHHPAPGLRAQDFVGAALVIAGIVGETLADEELRRFKEKPGHATLVYDQGLWAWTRHPNYVFEMLVWLSLPVIAIDLTGTYPNGWFVLGAPAFMFLVLTRITGIPPLERSLIESKGDAYRAYQARVSAFLPRPPRKT